MARVKGLYISYDIILLGCIILFITAAVLVVQQQIPHPAPLIQPAQPPINIKVAPSGDDRYTRAPRPERDWMAPPDFSSIRGAVAGGINVPTRGVPEVFQQMGIIKTEDGSVLPLY